MSEPLDGDGARSGDGERVDGRLPCAADLALQLKLFCTLRPFRGRMVFWGE